MSAHEPVATRLPGQVGRRRLVGDEELAGAHPDLKFAIEYKRASPG
jgi:hypothetical protein